MKELIAIIEDEKDILNLICLHLQRALFDVSKYSNGTSFLYSLENRKPDLIILDLMLPDVDGMEICSKLRSSNEYSSIPIIMLTAKSEESSKILGLESGADDYITKPFSPKELVARVKAVLRRNRQPLENQELVIDNTLMIDPQNFRVTLEDNEVALTTTEFRILLLLARHRGIVYSRDQILDHLWGSDKFVIDRTIDVHVKNLRKKLNKAGNLIKNIRGVGYKFEK